MELGPALDAFVLAMALPEQATVRQRVPKKHLLDGGKPTAADKREAQEGIEALWWVAVLRPGNCGIPAFRDEQLDYSELSVLALRLRPGANALRLVALVQRSIPYPLVLLVEQGGQGAMHLATKRASLNETGRWVVEQTFASGVASNTENDAAGTAFLASLPLHLLKAPDLYALYHGYILRTEALQAARINAHFVLATTQATILRRREALAVHARLVQELAATLAKARKEKVTSRAVALQLDVQRLQKAISECTAKL